MYDTSYQDKLRSQSNRMWHKGYADVYSRVTSYAPYKRHINNLVALLNIQMGDYVLDVGCGSGELLALCRRRTNHLYGIDYSKKMLQRAKINVDDAILQEHDLLKPLPFDNESFDRVISNNVMNYLTNPTMVISEILRVTKIGGEFVIASLKASFNPMVIFKSHLQEAGMINVLKNAEQNLMVGYYNRIIASHLKNGIYVGYSEQSMKDLLLHQSVTNIYVTSSYCGQDVVVTGTRA